MASSLKRLLIGKPLATERQQQERLGRRTALAVFSADALSSVSYATEAILTVLILGGALALGFSLPIGFAVAFLLVMVGLSYRQTIRAYPQGGGAYIVSRENLGEMPGLVAAGALMIDYVLTVAVSISAGVAAITSLMSSWGYPEIRGATVPLALLFIAVVTLINLRGTKESGILFAVPTYAFIIGIMGLIGYALIHDSIVGADPVVHAIPPDLPPEQVLGLWLLLRAFAAGCIALTGIEAISDGVQAFRPPEAKNAATTMTAMVILLVTMFLGITYLAYLHEAMPNPNTQETIISQVARTVFGVGPAYTFVQVATALILIIAANTAYADFPRLASFLSRDRFLPRQFASRGDRLVFSNGILVLGISSALLVVIFQANAIILLPLYAIGVFTSFTLSQTGMVRRYLRLQPEGWQRGLLISGIGALLTATVVLVLATTKFVHGAWAVMVLIPLMVLGFKTIQGHYLRVAEQLSLTTAARPRPVRRITAIVLVSGIHKGTLPALELAKSLSPDNVTAVYVNLDPEQGERVRARWHEWGCDVPLVILDSPYRSLITPLLKYVDEIEGRYRDDHMLIVLPEFIPSRWWQHLLHNQTGILLRTALMFRKGKTVISVPYKLER
ncbi:APC family permease [Candidatus Viridilinea mediisalina]|uniref:Amino acid permease n=1 Tax=Candidatus Viridilinea mediisalina TaxID=2024553 RepID=A0A2A6RJV0_9CHLR|nr:APC family permease [Candidatus Viridilinea mediisalina]PDW03166.1 amino acid permease [Candidatus Viridilinea mediisalina]